MMTTSQPILFLDLHGVLVNTSKIFESYKKLTVDHLIDDFGLSHAEAEQRYDTALKYWEEVAFNYLRNPSKKKVGPQFLHFLENCDAIFPKMLYKDLSIPNNCKIIRSRPFEFSIASQVEALYPEVRGTLETLYEHGYEMHVASSSFSGHIRGILQANNIDEFFESIIGFDTVAATKHTLKYYKKMLNDAQANPQRSVMIGNSMHEVLKPRLLGMRTVHINRERQVPLDVRKKADFSISDLSPLPEHLDVMQLF